MCECSLKEHRSTLMLADTGRLSTSMLSVNSTLHRPQFGRWWNSETVM